MDALHVSLPQGSAAGPLRDALEVAGVRPRKVTLHPVGFGSGLTVVAARYLAQVPPCPAISLDATGFGGNEDRPGLGCADLANFAAAISDPYDLFLNPALPSPDAERATLPVARLRAGPR